MKLADLFENDSLTDYFKQLQKNNPRFANLMPRDLEAQALHQQINSLARRIQAAGG